MQQPPGGWGPQQPQQGYAPPSQRTEQVFYQDSRATVTSARAILDGTTYALANITSVRAVTVKKGIGPLLMGILMVILGLPTLGAGAALGLAVIGTGAICILFYVLNKDQHFVFVGTAGAERPGLQSTNLTEIRQVADALNNAIVSRG